MSDGSTNSDASQGRSPSRGLDEICNRFEQACQSGKEPLIDEFVELGTEDEQFSSPRELLAELVGIDLEWRWRRAAEQSPGSAEPANPVDSSSRHRQPPDEILKRPLLENYVRRYPALGPLDELPAELVAHEYYVRCRRGDRPSHTEYQERYQKQWSDLTEILAEIDEDLRCGDTGSAQASATGTGETTLAYCVAMADGEVRPLLDAAEEAQLRTVFAIGTRVQNRYTLEEELGHGGMGHVYLARDTLLDRLVAIKVVVEPRGGGSDVLEEALAEEARLGAVLNHPAIATVFDFGFHEGKPFTVFEYVDGDTLRDVLRRRACLPLDEVRPIISSLAEALDFAHARGIVHRDLKPENIRAPKDGPFKILDLGLAKEFRSSKDWTAFAGTPAYASPEQAAGLPSDGRADQYALALITYEMLVGRRAFDHTDPLSLLRLHLEEHPSPPSIHVPELPEEVSVAIMRALDKDPRGRFATCEEFALELGPQHPTGPAQDVVLDRPGTGMINVYVCHVGEDSEIACGLAGAFEHQGYSTWYYERDTLPGISYAGQCADAIERSEVFLLLISSHSLTSHEVTTEIRQAYQRNRRFLPILVDHSQAEFQHLQPEWRSALGTAAVIELRGGDLTATVTRLARTLALWNIRPNRVVAEQTSVPQDEPDSDAVRKIWASDANQIDIRDLGNIVFKNEFIDEFLNRRGKCFLSANKGLGKTLLMTYKRYLLAETHRVAKQGKEHLQVFFVPEGRPYLDFMSDVRSLPKTHEQFLSELVNAKRMWGFALRISALSYHASLFSEKDANELARLPWRLRDWVQGSRIEPTVVFKEMLGCSVKEINRVIDDTENFLDHKFRLIHSGTMFFIDKVDQGIRHLSRSGWVAVQAGLIEAAWDAMNANSHIKVHATIRQEAFSNYESDIKANLYGATTMIRYSEDDLQRLLDQLTQCYEGSRSFKNFVNLNVVKHPHRAFPEDSFQYLRRHTLGRPRDLVIIASELSTSRNALSEPVYRRLVSDTSATVLISNVFDEMRVFLECLHDKRERLRFFSLLPYNILTRDELISICCRFNNISPDSYRFYASDSGQLHHPFCELFKAGLLGVVATDPDSRIAVQKFKQPRDLVSDFDSAMPEALFYLIHPALDGCIRKYRTTGVYNVFQHVIVGHDQPWEEHFGALCSVERALFPISDKELGDLVHDVLKRVATLVKESRGAHVRTVVEASKDWEMLREKLIEGEHDDLYLWLEELIDGGWAAGKTV